MLEAPARADPGRRAGRPPARRGGGGRREIALPGGVELELHAARLSRRPRAGVVVTLRDVTDERRLERARRDLVANVSHELKTPIAALKGFLELLEGDGSASATAASSWRR